MEFLGVEYLRKKLNDKSKRVRVRYDYYEMKNIKLDPSPAIPPRLKEAYASVLGWCGTAVDSLADRLIFEGFTDASDVLNFNDIFKRNNPDIMPSAAILDALIGSCSFIYISPDADRFPRLQALTADNATGIIDPITNMLTEGYAVLERDKKGAPISEAYFQGGITQIKTPEEEYYIESAAPYCLLVPIINRPDAKRLFGHSVISRACMKLTDGARNTLTRSEITAEFYSFPQKYVTGLSQDAEPLETWKATMSAMLQFTKDEDGDHPVVGQFQTASMTPHIEQFKAYAGAFAGETALTLDDLGIVTSNPTSSDAIKAAHERMRLKARAAQRAFGTAFKNVGFLAACLRDNQTYNREIMTDVKTVWAPIFEPDAAALGGIGDALYKLQQSFPELLTDDAIHGLTGL